MRYRDCLVDWAMMYLWRGCRVEDFSVALLKGTSVETAETGEFPLFSAESLMHSPDGGGRVGCRVCALPSFEVAVSLVVM